MNVLLDTQVLLWWLADDLRLPHQARAVVADPTSVVQVSAASAWEIAIKKAAGRLEAPDDLADRLIEHRFTPLAITFDHAGVAGRLPPHHRDPFDRILIAQAQCESLTVITVDRRFTEYEVGVLALL